MFKKTTLSHTHRISPTRRGTQFVTNYEIEPCWIHKLSPLHIASLANNHTWIRFRWRDCKGSFIVRRLDAQIVIVDNAYPWKAIDVSILLRVSFFLISVTKLWDMIFHLRMCNGHTGHTIVLDSKLSWLRIKQLDIILPVTVKWECNN